MSGRTTYAVQHAACNKENGVVAIRSDVPFLLDVITNIILQQSGRLYTSWREPRWRQQAILHHESILERHRRTLTVLYENCQGRTGLLGDPACRKGSLAMLYVATCRKNVICGCTAASRSYERRHMLSKLEQGAKDHI